MRHSGREPEDEAARDLVHTNRRRAAAAFLLAEALKPREGESFAALCERAQRTSPERPNGREPLTDLRRRDPVRAARYEQFVWTPQVLPLAQIRVWPGMDHLPASWCEGAVPQVASYVRRFGVPETARRMHSIWALTSTIEPATLIDWLECIPLPVIPDAMLHDRPPLSGAPWSLDDGCTRAVVLCLLGVESVRVLVGERSGQAPS